MKLVYICSPLRGAVKENKERAIDYCKFSSTKNVIPLAPHTIFTQYLDDTKKDEREKGLKMGLELLKKCNEISEGMKEEIKLAKKLKITIQLMQKEYEEQKVLTYEDCIKKSREMEYLKEIQQEIKYDKK